MKTSVDLLERGGEGKGGPFPRGREGGEVKGKLTEGDDVPNRGEKKMLNYFRRREKRENLWRPWEEKRDRGWVVKAKCSRGRRSFFQGKRATFRRPALKGGGHFQRGKRKERDSGRLQLKKPPPPLSLKDSVRRRSESAKRGGRDFTVSLWRKRGVLSIPSPSTRYYYIGAGRNLAVVKRRDAIKASSPKNFSTFPGTRGGRISFRRGLGEQ